MSLSVAGAAADRAGYGLIKTIAEKTSGAWRPSPGSIYPTLQQLVDEDLIEPISEGRRTDFTLPPERGQAEGGIHQFRAAATEEQRNAAVEKLDETRRALYRILAD